MNLLKIRALFDLEKTKANEFLSLYIYPWSALPDIGDFIRAYAATLSRDEYDNPLEDVWIAKSAKIFPSAYFAGPTVIGPETEVRISAFIRGSALVGEGCVIGNSTELKNVILFDGVQVPHFNYVGDSILGHRAHMGAGAITSNVKADHSLVTVHAGETKIETKLKKFGAMLGDYAEIGCNSVLNPGAIIGRRASVYPLSSVRGYVPADHIYKSQDSIVIRGAR